MISQKTWIENENGNAHTPRDIKYTYTLSWISLVFNIVKVFFSSAVGDPSPIILLVWKVEYGKVFS